MTSTKPKRNPTDWRAVSLALANALRDCVKTGALPLPVERRASAALRRAMPGTSRASLARRGRR